MSDNETMALMWLCLRQPEEKRQRHLEGWLSNPPGAKREAQILKAYQLLGGNTKGFEC